MSGTRPRSRVRELVYRRDDYRCVCCGQPVEGRPHSAAHRKRRSQGGSDGPENLLTFLGLGCNPFDPADHHARVDSRRDPADEAKGYTCRSWQEPGLIPVMVFSESGSGVMAWPTADGHWVTEAPAEGGAA